MANNRVILFIETSLSCCSCALYLNDSANCLAYKEKAVSLGHAEYLVPLIKSCFEDCNLSYRALSEIVVSSGPGSFTSVRVGLATAKGLALSLDIRCQALITTDILATEFILANSPKIMAKDKLRIIATVDSKRQDSYVQIFSPDRSYESTLTALTTKGLYDLLSKEYSYVIIGDMADIILKELVQLDNNDLALELDDDIKLNAESLARSYFYKVKNNMKLLAPIPQYVNSAYAVVPKNRGSLIS